MKFLPGPILVSLLTLQPGTAAREIPGQDRHVLVRWQEEEGSSRGAAAAAQQEIRRRNIRVLGKMRDASILLAVPRDQTVEGLHANWIGEVAAVDKVSEVAPPPVEPTFLIFEFYSDVEMEGARELLWQSGVWVREHPDLEAWQLLGLSDRETAMRVAGDDRVAYIFPASEEITRGIPVTPCRSAITEDGAPALLTAAIGNGWDGPGQNAVGLTYSFGTLTSQLPAFVIKDAVQRALAEWSRHAQISFTESSRRTANQNIDILFAKTSHGDQYPFDARGGVLAHTFYPAPPNSEPLAGDLHLDDDEVWNGGTLDLYSVVLHEIGHALGLGHSADPTAVMYPFYRQLTVLGRDDIQSLQQVYAAVGSAGVPAALDVTVDPVEIPATATIASLTGRVSGGRDPVSVSWSTAAGAFGVARGTRDWSIPIIPLIPGQNRVTVTASDSTAASIAKTVVLERGQANPGPPVITFVEPSASSGITVSSPTVRLRGTAAHPSGIESVLWRNLLTGGTGRAAGSSTWEVSSVPLAVGSNEVVIEAKAMDGSASSRSTLITMTAGTTPNPTNPTPLPASDVTAPVLAITSPSGTSVTVTASQITVKGTARDNVAVAAVSWTSATGQSGAATGTTTWTATIPLYTGMNNLIIRAMDGAGNSSWRSLNVTRR